MDSYGDGNVYRGQVCKDPEIKTIEINRQTSNYEMGCRVSKVRIEFIPRKTYKETFYISVYGEDMTGDYYPAESVERLVEAARHSKAAIDNYVHKEWGIQELQESYDKLRAALEPFNK